VIWLIVLGVVVLFFVIVAIYDLTQTKHAVLRNFPIIGHLRYILEFVGPELRQYIVTDNDEERPFSRDQRRWVYASAKGQNPYFAFGTDSDMDSPQYPLIRQATFPHMPASGTDLDALPSAKTLGEWRNRPGAFRPESVINISAMSFGSLSGPAIEALNKGAAQAGCMHNTGEGGISTYHRNGGDLILQIGTGYFGARNPDGSFSLDRLLESVESAPVKAIEIKLSQGAKPGLGGVLPAAKVNGEIAAARGVPVGITVNSPARHSSFDSVSTMVDFIERIAEASGLPVGIKSAVGEQAFWNELADHMAASGRGPDFVTIDGSEGGTGAAPLAFADHVSLPFRAGFAEVYRTFCQRDLQQRVTWIGSGRLGFPTQSLVAMAMGCDLINVGREAMLAVGCIQAQKCHTDHCPTGVATQNKRLTRGLDPTDKSVRAAGYVRALRHDLLRLAHACGEPHPALVSGKAIELVVAGDRHESLWSHYGYDADWDDASDVRPALTALMP
jgi:glutamate synthase domain-containing protein 2